MSSIYQWCILPLLSPALLQFSYHDGVDISIITPLVIRLKSLKFDMIFVFWYMHQILIFCRLSHDVFTNLRLRAWTLFACSSCSSQSECITNFLWVELAYCIVYYCKAPLGSLMKGRYVNYYYFVIISFKCYPGGWKINLIPTIWEILSQKCYHCVQYTRCHLMNLI